MPRLSGHKHPIPHAIPVHSCAVVTLQQDTGCHGVVPREQSTVKTGSTAAVATPYVQGNTSSQLSPCWHRLVDADGGERHSRRGVVSVVAVKR